MKRPGFGPSPRRGYTLQEIDKSLNDIYAAHERAAALPQHPANAKTRPHIELMNEFSDMRSRLNDIAATDKPTVGEVMKNRGGVPMSQGEFKRNLTGKE